MSLGAAAGGGLLLGFSMPAAGDDARRSVIGGDAAEPAQPGVFAPNAFVQIDRAGKVTLVMPKVEMGQGVYTALPMLIAEELEVPLSSVTLDHAPPNEKLFLDPLLGGQLTGGSTSVRYAWEPLRRAGATARTLLVAAAAKQWNVDPATCRAANGEVLHPPSGRRASYGQLADAAAKLPVPKDVALKQPADFADRHAREAARFAGEGRRHRAVRGRRAPARHAGRGDREQPGVRRHGRERRRHGREEDPRRAQVVRVDNAVAVVGDHTWAAKRGASALVVKWNEGAGAKVSTKDLFADLAQAAANGKGAVARKDGDVDKAFANAKTRVDAVYEQPLLAHATMEPVNCTVHVRGDGCEIWVGTQVPTRARDTVQQLTGLAPERIVVHNHLLGGGFGRRLETDMIGRP